MGATYLSIQVPDVTAAGVKASLLGFNAKAPAGLAAYLGPKLGRWTSVYPQFAPEMDSFAKRLSGDLDRIVLTLGSFDEDEFLCNVCQNGKDHGFFRVTVGTLRKGKQRDSVAKKLDLLADLAGRTALDHLLEKLSDTRGGVYSTVLLNDFCAALDIKNGRGNFDYIARGDYDGDFDEAVALERIG